MPHEKIYKHKRVGAPVRELRVLWGSEVFPEHVFVDLYRDGELRATMGLEQQDVNDLIRYLQKAKKATWPRA